MPFKISQWKITKPGVAQLIGLCFFCLLQIFIFLSCAFKCLLTILNTFLLSKQSLKIVLKNEMNRISKLINQHFDRKECFKANGYCNSSCYFKGEAFQLISLRLYFLYAIFCNFFFIILKPMLFFIRLWATYIGKMKHNFKIRKSIFWYRDAHVFGFLMD